MSETSKAAPRSDWNALLLVLLGGMLAILGGVIAQEYQARYAREQFQRDTRLRDEQEAVVALKEAGAAVDAPIARALLLLDTLDEGKADSSVARLHAEFTSAYETWTTERNRVRVLMAVYFGDSALARLASYDSNIVEGVRELPDMLRRLRKARSRPAEPAGFSSAPDTLKVQYRRALADERRHLRGEIHARLEMFRAIREAWFSQQMALSSDIARRRVGSFHPIARFALDPLREGELLERARGKRRALDSAGQVRQ